MSRNRNHRLSSAIFAGALLLGPAITIAAAPAALADPGTTAVVLVAEEDGTNTPYDRSTLVREEGGDGEVEYRDEQGNPVAPVTPAPGDVDRSDLARSTGSSIWRWLLPLLAIALLGYLFYNVRRRRILAEQQLVAEANRVQRVER